MSTRANAIPHKRMKAMQAGRGTYLSSMSSMPCASTAIFSGSFPKKYLYEDIDSCCIVNSLSVAATKTSLRERYAGGYDEPS